MNRYLLTYLASLALFGTNGVIASNIALGSCGIVLSRIVLGLAFLTAVCLIRRTVVGRQDPLNPRDVAFTAISGAAMGAGWLCLFEAYELVGVGLSTLLYYCGPIIIMAVSPMLFKEKASLAKGACFAVVLLGACLVSGASVSTGSDPAGIALGCLAALSYAVLVILGKKATGIEGVEKATVQLAGALVAVFALVWLKGDPMAILPSEGVGWALLLGIVNTGVGCYLYFSPLSHLKSQTIAVCGYLEPLSAVVFSSLFLHESLGVAQLAGGAMILLGAVAFELVGARRADNRSVTTSSER